MKKATLIICALIATNFVVAQRVRNSYKSGYATCSEFHITKPLRELCAENPLDMTKVFPNKEGEDRKGRSAQKFRYSADNDGPAYSNDPSIMQNSMGTIMGKAPLQSWTGQTAAGMYPLDPTGAAGPNNYVQMINATTYRIYSKTGATQLTGTLGNLFPSPYNQYNDGDPIVLYDKAADRWFFSQFGDNDGSNGNYAHIAISQTNDPTGAYYTYTFTMPTFPDYLKFSVWQDGYYMCCNLGTAQDIFAFERTKMLAGNSAARMVYQAFTPPDQSSNWFLVPLPADAGDGALPPAGTPCPVFSYSDNGWGGSYVDAINVYQASVNWTPATPTETITSAGHLSTSAFDATYDSNWNDIIEPPSWNTNRVLDGIGGTMMFRAQYKVWPTYNSVVVNWGVLISSSTHQRSIMWAELRQTGTTWAIYQQGIYTPDASTRWMGSIAMDNNGSIALCYMKSSASIYPGLYYTGRRACDPLGTMPITEVAVKAGAGSQTSVNRDGDYAETWLDPDGVTFWHTGMWFDASGNQQTQIYSFQIPACSSVGIAEESINNSLSIYPNPNNGIFTVSFDAALKTNYKIEITNSIGQLVFKQAIKDVSGTYSQPIDISTYGKGIYLLNLTDDKNQSIKKVLVY